MAGSESIKPQDVALLVKLVSHPEKEGWMQQELAEELFLSQSEIAKAFARLQKAELVSDKKPIRQNAQEFLIHAVKFAFPSDPGPLTMGVPTAISAPAHKKMVVAADGVEGVYVWPSPEGKHRGQSVKPLYKGLPEASLKDEKFYAIMAAIDIFRIGRAREKKAAQKFIEKVLSQ